jgi:hypothetical protein
VISVEDFTLNWPAAPPNLTPATSSNPEPLIVTSVPIVPEAGLNELTARAAAAPGTGTPFQVSTRAAPIRTPSAQARTNFPGSIPPARMIHYHHDHPPPACRQPP